MRAFAVLLVGATLAVYSPLRTHPFVNYDDGDYVLNNPHVTAGINWETVRWSLTSTEQANWFPLTRVSHALDCQWFGLYAGYHHITSLLLHALNVLLLFLLLRYATGATGTSFLVAAIFGLHPFNVETVAWIAERKNVLSMLFFLVTLGAYGWYAQKPKLTCFMAVVGAFVLALASKPMVVTLPFVLLLLDYWPLQRIAGWTEPSSSLRAPQRSARQLLLEKMPLLLLAAAGCVITLWAQESGKSVRSLASFSFGSRLGNAFVSYVIYLEKTFWPSGFAVFYPHPGASLSWWKPCLAAILLGAITVAVWRERVRRPYLAVGWLWFLGTMVPVVGIVQVGDQAMADRYAYLPLIGIFIIAVWGIRDLCNHFTVRTLPRALSAGLVLIILAFLTFRQLHYWQDDMSLWSHAFEVTPENDTVEREMGLVLIGKGDTEAGIPHLLTAIELNPDSVWTQWTHYYLGNAYRAEGRFEAAAAEFETIVSSSRDRYLTRVTHLAIADLLNVKNKYPEAIAEIRKAVAVAPDQGDSYLALALVETNAGEFDAAEANYKKAIDLTRDRVTAFRNAAEADPRIALATFYQLRGRYPEAEQQIKSVISSDPKDMNARASMAKLYIAEGNNKQAEAFLNQVKRDFPGNSNAYRMLADYYFKRGDIDRALAEYASLHAAHPKDLVVSKNYVQLLLQNNRLDEADKLNEELLSKAKDEDALFFRGEIQLRRGKVGEATRTLQWVSGRDPGFAGAHYQLGLALGQQGELDRAVSEWQQAVRLEPTLTDAYRQLAAASLRKGDVAGLEQYAGEMIRLEPAATEGYGFRAVSLIAQGRFAAAEADARKAIEVGPQSSVGYIEMGNLNLDEQKLPAAESWYELALAHDPDSLDALKGLVKVYLSQKRPDKAIARVDAQIVRSPANSAFYALLGIVQFDKKDLPDAATAFEKSAALNKNNVDAILKLAKVQMAMGKLDQSLSTLSEGSRVNPGDVDFYTARAFVYVRQNDIEKAILSYEKALELKPDDPGISNNLAYELLETHGNLDRALTLAQSARRGLPESPEVADTLGLALYQKGIYNSAIGMFEEAIRLSAKNKQPENATYHYQLGLAYEKAEKPALARQHFKHVLKIDPNFSDAAYIRRELAQPKS